MPEAPSPAPEAPPGVELPAALRTTDLGASSKPPRGKRSYDVERFVAYALKWTDANHEDTLNDTYPTHYENHCANFASQALDTTWKRTGGVNPNDPENWDPDLTGPLGASDAWAGARHLYTYAKDQKGLTPMTYVSDAEAGDLLFVDWDNDGDTEINHVTLITEVWHDMPKISQKSSNRHNMPWSIWRKIISNTTGPEPIFYGLHNRVEKD